MPGILPVSRLSGSLPDTRIILMLLNIPRVFTSSRETERWWSWRCRLFRLDIRDILIIFEIPVQSRLHVTPETVTQEIGVTCWNAD